MFQSAPHFSNEANLEIEGTGARPTAPGATIAKNVINAREGIKTLKGWS